MAATPKNSNGKVYEIVTEKILAALDQGTIPWRRPWRATAGGLHASLRSKRPYRGVNQMLLAIASATGGWSQPWWLTYKQAQELGGQVRQGEKSTLIVFWKRLKVEDRDPDTGEKVAKTIPMLRYFNVFNVEQVDGIEYPAVDAPESFDAVAEAESIIAGFPAPAPRVSHGGSYAAYSPAADAIVLPDPSDFDSPGGYYATAFHEHAHATGHESRLNRLTPATFGADPYAKEELVAEITAAMLCAHAGTLDDRQIDNTAAYIDGWRAQLSSDPRLVVSAAAAAQRAADFVLGVTFDVDTVPAAPGEMAGVA